MRPGWGASQALLLVEISQVRDGQQPKLREMILVKFGFGSFGFSGRGECAPEIYQHQFRLHFVSARQAAFISG
jgi:hypothetical protein